MVRDRSTRSVNVQQSYVTVLHEAHSNAPPPEVLPCCILLYGFAMVRPHFLYSLDLQKCTIMYRCSFVLEPQADVLNQN